MARCPLPGEQLLARSGALTMAVVVGIDGYRKGWIAVRLRDGTFDDADVGPDLGALTAFIATAQVVAIDMPIGLPVKGPRMADLMARAFVGARRSSVFATMPRDIWLAPDIETARAMMVSRHGRSFSTQVYALRDRVLEVDRVAASDPRFHEVHPEVSFREIAGDDLRHAKSTWAGAELRRSLLRTVGIEAPSDLGRAGQAGVDDVLDAAAAAWSADRIAHGVARSMPDPPESLPDGRTAAIWY